MTHEERKDVLDKLEKRFYTSKKWLSWFIHQGFMAIMAVVALRALATQPSLGWPLASFMIGIVFMMGISTMWYLGKQAAADIAVRGFALIGQIPKQLKDQLSDILPKKED
jgi:hypothetical protein